MVAMKAIKIGKLAMKSVAMKSAMKSSDTPKSAEKKTSDAKPTSLKRPAAAIADVDDEDVDASVDDDKPLKSKCPPSLVRWLKGQEVGLVN